MSKLRRIGFRAVALSFTLPAFALLALAASPALAEPVASQQHVSGPDSYVNCSGPYDPYPTPDEVWH